MSKIKEEIISKIRSNYSKVGFIKRIFFWKDIIRDIEREIELIDIKFSDEDYITRGVELEKSKELISKLENDLNTQISKYTELNSFKAVLENEINSKNNKILEYTQELHKVFKSSSGSQGKISELKIGNDLEGIFGKPGEIWVENLQVENGRVEFAIKTNPKSDKWVPIDSKSLIPEIKDSETNEFVIDKKYIAKVIDEAKKINRKYVNKNNTESYGLMVLPSENIYAELYYSEEWPTLFEKLISLNIFLTSPTNFIQFAHSVNVLNDQIKMVEDSRGLVEEMEIAYNHIADFHNSTIAGIHSLNTAFNTHIVNANKKLITVKEQIGSNKKLTELKNSEE